MVAVLRKGSESAASAKDLGAGLELSRPPHQRDSNTAKGATGHLLGVS
jgi:hypothetical protein